MFIGQGIPLYPPRLLPAKLAASAAGGTAYSFTGPLGKVNSGHYWTPAGYDPAASISYPILYFLHGKSSNSAATMSSVKPHLETAITALQIRKVILVAPSVGNTWYANSFDGNTPIEDQLIYEVIPWADEVFPSLGPAKRIIAGFSMGMFGAIRLSFKYLNYFRAVLGYAGPNHDADSNNAWGAGDLGDFNTIFGTLAYLRTCSPMASIGLNGIAQVNTAAIIARALPTRIVKSAADAASLGSLNNFNTMLGNLGIARTFVDLITPTHNPGLYLTADAGAGFAFLESNLGA
jgi:S-formylglutathione hydrolase FrmB